jgi:hypothetical protein
MLIYKCGELWPLVRVTRQPAIRRELKLTEELCILGKHHMPAKGEPWDFDVPGSNADAIPPLWRKAVFEAGCLDEYIEDLLGFLVLKAEKAEQAAKAAGNSIQESPDPGLESQPRGFPEQILNNDTCAKH